MAHDLDIRQFFRRAPQDWLKRYFESKNALIGFDWNSISVRNVDPLVKAWLELDDTLRGQMTQDFAHIKLLATPAGKMQIIDESFFHDAQEVVSLKLAELDDIYECAFWTMLEQPECWNGAVFYAAADSKPRRYWRKRVNMPELGRKPTELDGDALAKEIVALFRWTEGRGDHCVVRQYRRGRDGEREYYFAYPQDHKQSTIQFDNGEMAKRPYNPAFEIIFVHNDSERTLTIWHDGPKTRVQDLQVAFARAILNQEILKDCPRDERVYDLSRFRDPDYQFSPDDALGIERVEIRKIGMRTRGSAEHVVSIDLGRKTPGHMLGQRIEAATQGIPRSAWQVARVGLRVIFEKKSHEAKRKTRSFEIVWPNSCSVQDDEYGIVIQRLLADHGIEPKVPRNDEPNGARRA